MNAFGLYAQIIGVYDSGLIAPDYGDRKAIDRRERRSYSQLR